MKNKLPLIGLSVGLLGGAGAGLIMTVPGISGAVEVQQTDTTTDTADTTSTADEKPARGEWAKEAIDALVADGTLTQAQADKVIAALEAARPAGRGGMGHGGFGRGAGIEAMTEALGVTADELRTALQGGQSIADVAAANNVDVQVVIDAATAQAKSRLDAKVADGSLTQAEADTRLAEITTRVTEMVNTPGDELRMGGRGGRGGRGDHSHDDDVAASDDAETATTTG